MINHHIYVSYYTQLNIEDLQKNSITLHYYFIIFILNEQL